MFQATLRRFDALTALARRLGDDALVVTNLANTATEWFAARPSDGNLYAVGMGMVSAYALGIARALPHRDVVALDGDGGIFFDASLFGLLAASPTPRLRVVVFDNGGYISTGKLPVVGSLSLQGVDIAAVARSFGMTDTVTVSDVEALDAVLAQPLAGPGPQLIVVRVTAEQAFVGALPMDLKENKYRFVRHVERSEGRRILKPSAKEHGAKPPPDPAAAAIDRASFARVLYDGLKENGIDFAVGLPCSGFTAAQALLIEDNTIDYVGVAHEGTGLGLCAGAWLAGRRPAALIENFGLFASAYHLLRGHMSFGLPTLIVTEFRGDTGDQEFFAEGGEVTLDVLAAMRINHRLVSRLEDVKPAIRDALRWMDGCLRPFALVPAFDLTRQKA
jgi:sulfopyruvate decarboxylase TPP-binding subunit